MSIIKSQVFTYDVKKNKNKRHGAKNRLKPLMTHKPTENAQNCNGLLVFPGIGIGYFRGLDKVSAGVAPPTFSFCGFRSLAVVP